MWKSFKAWFATDKAVAITNGAAAVFWGIMAASSDMALVRWLGMTNAVLFAAVAGLKFSEHFNKPLIAMWRAAFDDQLRLTFRLITEHKRAGGQIADEPGASPELEDDMRLS